MSTHHTDVAIIGAGPVGLFAVFECGMLKMHCHVIDSLEAIGGQCMALYPEKPIYDIPAYPQVMAGDLIEHLQQQAAPFAPVYHLDQQVVSVRPLGGDRWLLKTSKETGIDAAAIVIAGGSGAFGPNRPPLADIEAYEGTSVFYLVRRREEFRDKRVVIAGGGDSAVDWALSLFELASKVYVVHRRPKFRAAPDSVEKMNRLATDHPDRLELVIPYQLHGLEGQDGQLSRVVVSTLKGETRALETDVLLPFFGLSMNLGPIAEWGLNLKHQHIEVDPATGETNRPGIYAVGDIATYPSKLKLILCGFSEAAMTAHAIYHRIHPDQELHWEYSTTQGIPGS